MHRVYYLAKVWSIKTPDGTSVLHIQLNVGMRLVPVVIIDHKVYGGAAFCF